MAAIVASSALALRARHRGTPQPCEPRGTVLRGKRELDDLLDQVFVLAEGRMIAMGPPDAIAADARVIEAYLGHGAAERMRGAAHG